MFTSFKVDDETLTWSFELDLEPDVSEELWPDIYPTVNLYLQATSVIRPPQYFD